MHKKQRQTGFTIVELLLVVVIIGILAALVLNTFEGIQARARDTKRRDDTSVILKSLEGWNILNDAYGIDGAGANGFGFGWINHQNNSNYQRSIIGELEDAGFVARGAIDPAREETGIVREGYMLYVCFDPVQRGYKAGVFAQVDDPTPEDDAGIAQWIADGCTNIPVNTWERNHVRVSTGRGTQIRN